MKKAKNSQGLIVSAIEADLIKSAYDGVTVKKTLIEDFLLIGLS